MNLTTALLILFLISLAVLVVLIILFVLDVRRDRELQRMEDEKELQQED